MSRNMAGNEGRTQRVALSDPSEGGAGLHRTEGHREVAGGDVGQQGVVAGPVPHGAEDVDVAEVVGQEVGERCRVLVQRRGTWSQS